MSSFRLKNKKKEKITLTTSSGPTARAFNTPAVNPARVARASLLVAVMETTIIIFVSFFLAATLDRQSGGVRNASAIILSCLSCFKEAVQLRRYLILGYLYQVRNY